MADSDLEIGRKIGIAEGREAMKKEILTHLERKYMDPNISVTDPSMQAVLVLAKEISETFSAE